MISKEGFNIIIYSIIPKISHFGYIIKIFSSFLFWTKEENRFDSNDNQEQFQFTKARGFSAMAYADWRISKMFYIKIVFLTLRLIDPPPPPLIQIIHDLHDKIVFTNII